MSPSPRRRTDAHKGSSVFHHIIHANRMTEVVYTLLITEVIKASDPATITYSAAQMAGQPPPPLNFKPGGNNQRTLNAQKVEIAPTSPRPTDTSPGALEDHRRHRRRVGQPGHVRGGRGQQYRRLRHRVDDRRRQGHGAALPRWPGAIYQALKARMYTLQYATRILPQTGIMSVPMEGKYGSSPAAISHPRCYARRAPRLPVEIVGVSDQQLPMLVNAAGAAVERGFWSRRKAMEKLGEKDPSRMIQDIIIERALEHPEMMENFLIPINFIRAGQKDLADLWVLMVVMPKVQMLMAQMLGPQAGGAMSGAQQSGAAIADPQQSLAGMQSPAMLGGGTPPAAPEPNGQSNPMAGRARGAPTGPMPGQGRGPAPRG